MATEAKGQRVNINGKVTDVLYKDEMARNTLSQLTYPGHDQAIMGTDSYVCDVGQKFAPTLVSNTSLTLADGEGVLQGVRFRIPYGSTVALTIASGTSGYKRIDLVVARYTKSTGAISFVVIKGTNATSSPAIPAYNTGSVLGGAATVDFPLYKITLDGTTVSSVDKLFTQLQTMAELQTDVNKLNTDTIFKPSSMSFRTGYSSTSNHVYFSGKFLVVMLVGLQCNHTPIDDELGINVPVGYTMEWSTISSVDGISTIVKISPDGKIHFWSSMKPNTYYVCSLIAVKI